MIFLTPWFWGFFAIVLAAYWLVGAAKIRLFGLLLTSIIFQWYFAGPRALVPILVLELVTYLSATKYQSSGNRRWLHGAIAVNVAALIFFKYLDFLTRQLFWFLGVNLPEASLLGMMHLPVPLGISFFVFEFVHYLVEVDRGMAPARSWVRFWVFASYFPSMVSGPIKRFPDFDRQLDDLRRPAASDVLEGSRRAVVGAFKKIVLAEPCHAYAMWYMAHPGEQPLSCLLIALSFQIYFDFAGYSDIAIGVSRMLGLRLPENFNNPYAGRDISEFWRRWHMSLSTWIRDYIYIPLGGNQVSVPRKILNASIAMFLCGLWHGAALHFGLWGLWHAFLLGLHGAIAAVRQRIGFDGGALTGFRKAAAQAGGLSYHAFTLVAVAVGWLLFFYDVPSIVKLLNETERILW